MAEKKSTYKPGNKKGQEYKLSVREQKFVSLYLEYGDPTKACIEAKFTTNAPKQYARKLLSKPKIQKEVARQLEEFKCECIASSQEIMNFYTLAMRGEIKDQFGLDATLADRMKAAEALAKRQIDAVAIANRVKENEFTINLNWNRENTTVQPNLPAPEDDDLSDEPVEDDTDAE